MKTMMYDSIIRIIPTLGAVLETRRNWSALDILDLPPEDASDEEKIEAVLREDLIDAPILHEFACRCAESALSRVESPDPRSIAAIEAMCGWMRGEITGYDLCMAESSAFAAWSHAEVMADVASGAWSRTLSEASKAEQLLGSWPDEGPAIWSSAWLDAWSAAWSAAQADIEPGTAATAFAAKSAEWASDEQAALSAAYSAAAGAAAGVASGTSAACPVAWLVAAERAWQVAELRNMLQGQ